MFGANHTDILLGDLLPIYGDGSSIYQVFMNIINNAVKYSSTNPQAKVCIHSEKVAKGILYHIIDDGIGIPASDLARIRQNHARASNAHTFQGKGIGLFIVKKILERLGAQMDILSKEGQGTEIRLLFP